MPAQGMHIVTDTTPPEPVSVQVHAARLTYGGAVLFDALDFTLEAGRTTCLLGPSGVGKTSLIRLVASLAEGQDGNVRCSDGKPLEGRYAWMAQQDLLLPWLTVRENVTLGARLRGNLPHRQRADDLLSLVGLADYADERPAALSGGMRQRVALARTLMEDRPVVLMDEPFSALDAVTRFQLQDAAAELLRDRTVLLVTHDPLEALRLGHHIHVMAGRPARLDEALTPVGDPPRDPRAPGILALQAELLTRLATAREATA
jgi:putative hydroxymethylpyrimidine transport system ATP-binding protein